MQSCLRRFRWISLLAFLSVGALDAQVVQIVSGTPPNAALNTPYKFAFHSQGGGCSARISDWTATGLPAGLSLNSSTGVLSGTPTAAGTSSVNVTFSVSNCTGQTTSRLYTIQVASPQEGFYVLDPDPSSISVVALNASGGTGNCADVMSTDPCFNYVDQTLEDFAVDSRGNFYIPAGSAVIEFAPRATTPTTPATTSSLG